MFNKALTRAGYPFTAPPESTYWDFDASSQITKLTRAGAAAMLAYTLRLPMSPPSVYLQFDFPQSANAGFDFGYEVQRKFEFESSWKKIWVQDPPEEGMEEASDFGMFYDSSISDTSGWRGRWFDYRVYLFNRAGDHSNYAETRVYF